MIGIDAYAYINNLKAVHPLEKALFAILTMVVCLFSPNNITPLIVLALMATATLWKAGISGRVYARLLLLPLSFLVLSVLTIAFSVSLHPAGFWFSFPLGRLFIGVRSPDVLLAGHLFLKSLGTVSCLYFLALTTPMTEIITLLYKLKTPALVTELMILIYRFIFVFLESAATIRRAQHSRLGYITVQRSFYAMSQLFVALFGKIFQHSRQLADAMDARCYTGEIRVLAKPHMVNPVNYIIIAALNFILVSVNILGR